MKRDITKYVGNKMRELRKAQKLTQKELGAKLGLAHNTISSYENGINEVEQDVLFTIANILGVSINDFFPPIEDHPSNIYQVKPDFVKIPILGEIACGEPLLVQEHTVGYMWELVDGLPRGELFALIAKGDSMEPTISNGVKVLVRQQDNVENGEIAAVLVNGDSEATLKRIKKQGNTIMLLPDNARYDIIIVDENNPARIIGKVIRTIRDFI